MFELIVKIFWPKFSSLVGTGTILMDFLHMISFANDINLVTQNISFVKFYRNEKS